MQAFCRTTRGSCSWCSRLGDRRSHKWTSLSAIRSSVSQSTEKRLFPNTVCYFSSLLTDGLRLTRVTDMERAEDAFRLRNLAPAQRVAIFLEVSETLPRVATPSQVSPMASPAQVGGSTVLQMRVEARWSNASTPDLLRVKHSVCPLPRGLPFSITVKDFFRARKSVAPLAVTL